MPLPTETLNRIDTEQAYRTLFEDSDCVRPTDIIYDSELSRRYEADIFLLSELSQVTGAYKMRGAYNWFAGHAAGNIGEVVAFSAGNHAAAVAACARHFDTRATIFMPENTPQFKMDLVRRLGGNSVRLVGAGNTVDDSAQAGLAYLEDAADGTAFIHPFDDELVVAGQGTLGVELRKQFPDIDVVISPVGGGGLLSGIVHATSQIDDLRYVAVEPAGAPSLAHNMRTGEALETIDTFVDGAAVRQVGGICLDTLAGIEGRYTVVHPDNASLCRVLTGFWEDGRQLRPELAGILAVASLDKVQAEIKGKTVACVMSGGNLSRERFETEVRYP